MHIIVDRRLHLEERHGCGVGVSSSRDWRCCVVLKVGVEVRVVRAVVVLSGGLWLV